MTTYSYNNNQVITQSISSFTPVDSVNNIAFFTTDVPANVKLFDVYDGPSKVTSEGNYSVNSSTDKTCQAMFAQSPRFNNAGGSLYVIPLRTAVSATAKTITTLDLSGKIDDFKVITDGSITIYGEEHKDINFTGSTTLQDIFDFLYTKLKSYVNLELVGTTIVFTHNKLGADANATFTITDGATGTNLAGSDYLDIANAVVVDGVNASGKTLLTAINETIDEVPSKYTTVITNLEMEDSVLNATATSIQANENTLLFAHHLTGDTLDNAKTEIKDAGLDRTIILNYAKYDVEKAHLGKAALVSKYCSMDFNSAASYKTVASQKLIGSYTDELLNSSTIQAQLKTAGVGFLYPLGDTYQKPNRLKGLNLQLAVKALASDILISNVNAFANASQSQTDGGDAQLKLRMNAVFGKYQAAGVIQNDGKAVWYGSPIGGNIKEFESSIPSGYYIYTKPNEQKTQAEKLEERFKAQVAFVVTRFYDSFSITLNFE